MIPAREGPILALDLSAGTGSLALLATDGTVEAVRRWPEARRGSPALWAALSELWAAADREEHPLSCLVTGRGPGRYTGLRTSVTLMQALALPRSIPVHAVDSGTALALSVIDERSPARVAVAGDARRGQCWLKLFRNNQGWPEPESDWRLCPADAGALALPPNTIGVSPEWSRLAALPGLAERGEWIAEDRSPDAIFVGRLALRDRAEGRASAPLSPLYLHPAVAS